MSRPISGLLLVLLLSFFLPASVLAHKVNIFAFFEDGKIYSESYFPDGRPVEAGAVRVYDAAGKLLLEGQTDKSGQFQFTADTESSLVLEIDAGMGHKNTFELKKTAN